MVLCSWLPPYIQEQTQVNCKYVTHLRVHDQRFSKQELTDHYPGFSAKGSSPEVIAKMYCFLLPCLTLLSTFHLPTRLILQSAQQGVKYLYPQFTDEGKTYID